MSTKSNLDKFTDALEIAYVDLFANDPRYNYVSKRTTPRDLSVKMTSHLVDGRGDKDGNGVKMVCKLLGIKSTYKAISAFLQA